MEVVEQALGENCIGRKELKRQKVVKKPEAKAVATAEGPKGVRRLEKT